MYAKEIQAPYALVAKTKELGRLPVVNFAAGGVATPADALLVAPSGSLARLFTLVSLCITLEPAAPRKGRLR